MRFIYFCLDLPHSDGCFVKAYPAENAAPFQDGHVAAFAFLGGVPRSILYDNTQIAVAKMSGSDNGKRQRAKAFSELQRQYLFRDKSVWFAKGSDKGNVEGVVGYSRRHFMVPHPIADDLDTLNAKLLAVASNANKRNYAAKPKAIAKCMKRDFAALMALPPVVFDPCHKIAARVTSLLLQRIPGWPAYISTDTILTVQINR